MQSEDELGLVVRAHIYIEAKLVEFLELLADGESLDKMEWTTVNESISQSDHE